jgi:hypothetical protein
MRGDMRGYNWSLNDPHQFAPRARELAHFALDEFVECLAAQAPLVVSPSRVAPCWHDSFNTVVP